MNQLTVDSGQLTTILAELSRLVADLQSQDNRATGIPLFAVMQKQRIYGLAQGYGDDVEVVRADDGKKRKVRYVEVDVFVTACLTERGCQDYIALNGHNLTRPFIYVFSGYRNGEWKFLRDALPVVLEALKAGEAQHV